MKNLFTIISFAILGSILFSSCGSSLTITKRKVNKGFYIASNRNKAFTKNVAEKQADQPFHNKAVSEIAIGPESAEPAYTPAQVQTQAQTQAQTNEQVTADAVVVEKTAEPAASKHKTIRERIAASESTGRFIEKVSHQPKKHLEKLKQKSSPQPIVGAVLSLFWIVILLIFLLYLIGLLAGGFGLGGLIHLLLVITLILLILWLLGIV